MKRLFNRKAKQVMVALVLCLLIGVLTVQQPTSFAWLSAAMRSTTFAVKSSSVSTMSAELWINAYTPSGDWTQGWYVDEIEEEAETAKRFSPIGKFTASSTTTTFTPASPIALHFGTINNLVQEQENQPIYLKFAITLKPKTSNTVILSYKNDAESVGGQYLSVYSIDFTKLDAETGKYVGYEVTDADILSELNTIERYPFLRFHYFVSTVNYTFTPGVDDLTSINATSVVDGVTVNTTVDFPSLFEDENNPDVVEYTLLDETSHNISFDNENAYSKQTYIYVKINVRPDTLSEALTNSDLKNCLPAYLLFAVILGMEIRTSAYNPTV